MSKPVVLPNSSDGKGYDLVLKHDPTKADDPANACSYEPDGRYEFGNGAKIWIRLGGGFTPDAAIEKIDLYYPKPGAPDEAGDLYDSFTRRPDARPLSGSWSGKQVRSRGDGRVVLAVGIETNGHSAYIEDHDTKHLAQPEIYHFSLQVRMGGKMYGHDPEMINKGN